MTTLSKNIECEREAERSAECEIRTSKNAEREIAIAVRGDGFLYNMARAMAGTVVYAAEGKFPPEAVADILAGCDRTAAGPTVPPGGLYMTKLWYDDGEVCFHVG